MSRAFFINHLKVVAQVGGCCLGYELVRLDLLCKHDFKNFLNVTFFENVDAASVSPCRTSTQLQRRGC